MTSADDADAGPESGTGSVNPKINWYYLGSHPIQSGGNAITFPDGVFFYGNGIVEPGEDVHWTLDLVNTSVLVSRYEPRIPLPGRTPHPESLLEEKDIHNVESTGLGKDPTVATIPKKMMVESGCKPRGEILSAYPAFWFSKGETCHFIASNTMIHARVMYMLKDEEGREFVNEFIDAGMEEYYTHGGEPLPDGGEPNPDREMDRSEDVGEEVIPEAIVSEREVLNLTTGEVLSFAEAEEQLEDQRVEIEQWLKQKRADAERMAGRDTDTS